MQTTLLNLPSLNWPAWLQAIGATLAIILAVVDSQRRDRLRRHQPALDSTRFSAMLHRELAAVRWYVCQLRQDLDTFSECPIDPLEDHERPTIRSLRELARSGVASPIEGLSSLPLDAWPDGRLAALFWTAIDEPMRLVGTFEELLNAHGKLVVDDPRLQLNNLRALIAWIDSSLEDAVAPVFDECELRMELGRAKGLGLSYQADLSGSRNLEWVPSHDEEDPRCGTMGIVLRRHVGSSWKGIAGLKLSRIFKRWSIRA